MDFKLYEQGDGGELNIIGGDIESEKTLLNAIYLSLFSGDNWYNIFENSDSLKTSNDIENLLQNFIISNKNVNLTQKIECMSKRTTKEKILTFLSLESIKTHSKEFTISLDRQALANYLGVERSAMSAELSKLRKEGIIEYKKNRFKLL